MSYIGEMPNTKLLKSLEKVKTSLEEVKTEILAVDVKVLEDEVINITLQEQFHMLELQMKILKLSMLRLNKKSKN